MVGLGQLKNRPLALVDSLKANLGRMQASRRDVAHLGQAGHAAGLDGGEFGDVGIASVASSQSHERVKRIPSGKDWAKR